MGIDVRVNGGTFEKSLTFNLTKMAEAAGLYQAIFRPNELGNPDPVSTTAAGNPFGEITKPRVARRDVKAAELIAPLSVGLRKLKADPDKFKVFNPENGWGSYDGLVRFVEAYLRDCIAHPDGEISIW